MIPALIILALTTLGSAFGWVKTAQQNNARKSQVAALTQAASLADAARKSCEVQVTLADQTCRQAILKNWGKP